MEKNQDLMFGTPQEKGRYKWIRNFSNDGTTLLWLLGEFDHRMGVFFPVSQRWGVLPLQTMVLARDFRLKKPGPGTTESRGLENYLL